MKMAKRGIVVLLLLLAGSLTTWGAGTQYNKSDYTEEYFYGKPGHKGEEARGTMRVDSSGTPRAFYAEGQMNQIKNAWVGIDLYKDGVYQKECWYYFESTDYVTRKWLNLDGKWYYRMHNGVVGGWEKIDGHYYYFDPVERYMWTSGDVERNDQMYTIGSDGIALAASQLGYVGDVVSGGGNSGWATENNKWYYLRNGERIKNEWLQDGADLYYLGDDGYIFKGAGIIDGEVYCFDAVTGKMKTNVTSFHGIKKFWFGEDGKGVELETTVEERVHNSEVAKWMRATYAIYTEETFAMVAATHVNYDPPVVREKLASDWGISGAEEGWNTIDALVSSAQMASNKVTKAWDYSRAMMLCGALCDGRYITELEKSEKQITIAPLIQSNFSSWDDFNDNYMEGYRGWANAAGRGANVQLRESLYKKLKESTYSPYRYPWTMSLEKDW